LTSIRTVSFPRKREPVPLVPILRSVALGPPLSRVRTAEERPHLPDPGERRDARTSHHRPGEVVEGAAAGVPASDTAGSLVCLHSAHGSAPSRVPGGFRAWRSPLAVDATALAREWCGERMPGHTRSAHSTDYTGCVALSSSDRVIMQMHDGLSRRRRDPNRSRRGAAEYYRPL
jgi:hypothetical protein